MDVERVKFTLRPARVGRWRLPRDGSPEVDAEWESGS